MLTQIILEKAIMYSTGGSFQMFISLNYALLGILLIGTEMLVLVLLTQLILEKAIMYSTGDSFQMFINLNYALLSILLIGTEMLVLVCSHNLY